MKRSVVSASIALIAALISASSVMARNADTRDPNIERLGDISAEVRATAARTLGAQ